MTTNLDTLEEFLLKYGWNYEIRDAVVITDFKGANNVFHIFIQSTDVWVVLAIVPFTPRPLPECAERFYQQLAQVNYDLNLTKLCADIDGDLALLSELPALELTYAQFALALDALCYYADTYYLPLLNMARDPMYIWPIVDEQDYEQSE